jgi:predicted AlkP superfamily pyrophosphatase or phosphodiesterase
VVWISLDGFRGDYLQRVRPPTMSRLAHEGAFTSREVPIFPSLTFPNHIAQATGRTADGHGIPLNTFYDSMEKRLFTLPDNGEALRAEPIWITARRQGLRTAVVDWPMSHGQTGEFKSDFFYPGPFDNKRSDQQRMDELVQILGDDKARPPLRLVMSYIKNIDVIGHASGPNSPQVEQAVRDVDAIIDGTLKSIIDWFNSTHSPQDELYLLLTADHGMERVHTVVSLERLLGAELLQGARVAPNAPIACIYLDDLPASERDDRASRIVARLRENSFLSAWKSRDVPPQFHFSDPTRLGDVVVLLAPGFNGTALRIAATQPVPPGANLGAHGYDPAVCPAMLGGAIIWRYRHPIGGVDLGEIHNTQWHSTVAHMLGIQPAAGADPRYVQFKSN